MVTEVGGSYSPSTSAQQWAAQQAAAEAARRAAEEAARQAAERARIAANNARIAAANARELAKQAAKAAEDARAKAAKSKLKADMEEAKHQADLAAKAELAAMKAEAASNLCDKQKVLADAKVQDTQQGRPSSDATRAAQAEVDAAKRTASLYEPGASKGKNTPLDQARKVTQDKLDKAEKARKAIWAEYAHGHKPTKKQIDALNAAVDEWLQAGQQQMRLAALTAQAAGKSPQAAIQAERKDLGKALEHGGVFLPKELDKYIDLNCDQVKSESDGVWQLRSEEFSVMNAGLKQLADARAKLPELDQAAKRAAAYADSFKTASTDSQVTAQQAAQADAAAKQAAADAAHNEVDGLALAYEGNANAKDSGHGAPGSVQSDYESRIADQNVKTLSDKFAQAQAGGDKNAISAAGLALDNAITQQTFAHADRDVSAATLQVHDSRVELGAIQGLYDQLNAGSPAGGGPTQRLDPSNPADQKRVQLIDGKYYLITHHAPITHYVGGGKSGGRSVTKNVPDTRQELDPLTAKLWAANDKLNADQKTLDAAASRKTQAEQDLLSPDGKTAAKLDTNAWLSHEKELNDSLNKANSDVSTALNNLTNAPASTSPQDLRSLQLALGTALQNQQVAQADMATLAAMRKLSDALHTVAAGGKVDDKEMEQLRTDARAALDKSASVGPELNAANEKAARVDFAAQSNALKKQQAAVNTAQTNYNKAIGTKDEAAAKKTLDDAIAKRTQLDRVVRNYQTLLGGMDADRLALAAPAEYAQHKFVKPQLSMFMLNGQSVTDNMYSRDYNPTWSIKPDANGKVQADGLPRGLKPEDVVVKKVGDEWVVTFKKDSKVMGYNADNKSYYYVPKGDVKMDATTAALWDAQANKTTAGKARQNYLNEMKDIGLPMSNPAGANGNAIPGLNLGGDLTQRRKQVSQNISDLTQGGRGHGAVSPQIEVARAELKAIDSAIAWQNADVARQDADSHPTMCYADGKTPQDVADALRADAVAARTDWLAKLNKLNLDTAGNDLKLKQNEYDQWKADHPYLLASGSDSPAGKALQQAQARYDNAGLSQRVGAGQDANAKYQQLLADKLRPDQVNDPSAMYDLFMQNPQVMAQAIINQHFLDYGMQPIAMAGRTQITNEVGIALGWQTDTDLDPNAPVDSEDLRRTQNLFTHLSDDQKGLMKSTVDTIIKLGGKHAKVSVLPVVYALPGEHGGVVKTAIFKVECDDGSSKLVDEHGREYKDARDYRANNLLPVDNVNLAMPDNANVKVDANGNIKLFTGDARTETGWETVRRKGHIDLIVGVTGLVAGTVLAVGSLGSLSVPGGVLMAASIAMISTSAYGVVTSAQSLESDAEHGVDINPVSNRQARMDWLNLGLSAASVPVAGASARATLLGVRAAKAFDEAGKTADAVEQANLLAKGNDLVAQSAAWERPAQLTGKVMSVGGGVATEEGVRYMLNSWSSMTPAQRRQQIGMLGLNIAGFASPVFARGYEGAHGYVKTKLGIGTNEVANPTGNIVKLPAGQQPGEDAVVTPANDGSLADVIPIGRNAGDGDPLTDFRPVADTHVPAAGPRQAGDGAPPKNVRPLHPNGQPSVPHEAADAPIAPVLQFKAPKTLDPTDPSDPLSEALPLAQSQPEVQLLRLAAGAEDLSNGEFQLPDRLNLVVGPVNAQLSANGPGPGKSGQVSANQQQQPHTPTTPATPTTQAQNQPTLPAPSNSIAPGFGADGMPLPADSFKRGTTWEELATRADKFKAKMAPGRTQKPPTLRSGDREIFDTLKANPDRRSAVRFVVSSAGPKDTVYAGQGFSRDGLGAEHSNVYQTYEAASAAAAQRGGGWVNRVSPDASLKPLSKRLNINADEIVGAVYVHGDGRELAVPFPNATTSAPGTSAFFDPKPTVVGRIKGQLASKPEKQTIAARKFMLGTAVTKFGLEVLGPMVPGISWVNSLAHSHAVNAGTYPPSTFGRGAYMFSSQRMKTAMAAATAGNRAKAEAMVGNLVKGKGWRGDQIDERSSVDERNGRIWDVLDASEPFWKQHAQMGTDAPNASRFKMNTLKPTSEETFAPSRYFDGVPGLTEFFYKLTGEKNSGYYFHKASAVKADLLQKLSQLDAATLAKKSTDSADITPEARLLRQFPDVQKSFADTVGERQTLIEAHQKLYDTLLKLIPDKEKPGMISPKAAEDLAGSTNSPGTQLGKINRRVTIVASTNVVAGWFFKGANLDSPMHFISHFADLFAVGSLWANVKYNGKVDELAAVNEEVEQGANRAGIPEKEFLEANPGLKKRKEDAKDAKNDWNRIRDVVGLSSAARAGLGAYSLHAQGAPELLVIGGAAQGALTAAWVGMQLIPTFRNGAVHPATVTLKWATVVATLGVPAATLIWQLLSDKASAEHQSVAGWAGKWTWKGMELGWKGIGEAWGGIEHGFKSTWQGHTSSGNQPTQPSPSSTPSPTASVKPTATVQPSPTASNAQPPAAPPAAPPAVSHPPKPHRPKTPQPIDHKVVTVDSHVRDLSTFTNIAEAKARRDGMGYNEALDQLFNLNPRYKRSQMDGYVSPTRTDDPDALDDGVTQIDTGVPAHG